MILNLDKDVEWHDFQYVMLDKFRNSQRLALFLPRQHGKSYFAQRLLLNFMLTYKKRKNPVCYVVAPTVNQSFELFFQKIHEQLSALPGDVYWKRGSKEDKITAHLRREDDVATVIFTSVGSQVRGGTADLVIGDEFAYWTSGVWEAVFNPFLDATNGKAILMSTVKEFDHFYKMLKDYEKKSKTDSYYSSLFLDVYTAKHRSEEWIKRKEAEYRAVDKFHVYMKEYLGLPFGSVAGASPYSERVFNLQRGRKQYVEWAKDSVAHNKTLYCAFDIGAPKNSPGILWSYNANGKPVVLTVDEGLKGIFNLPGYLISKYGSQFAKFEVFVPHDINKRSEEIGQQRLARLYDIIAEAGLWKRMNVTPLEKTKNLPAMHEMAQTFFDKCYFDEFGCQEGLQQLARATWRTDAKTDYILVGSWVRNGAQHVADAFAYASEADRQMTIGGMQHMRNSALGYDEQPIGIDQLTYWRDEG